MTDEAASTTCSNKRASTTMPTSKSIAYSDAASVSSAPINHPEGHPGTRANTVFGDQAPLSELHAHHIHARLLSGLSSSTRPSMHSSVGEPLDKTETADTEGVLEFSNWGDEALDQVRVALAKLAQLARDEHKATPEKSVQDAYSERLAKLIEGGDVVFDVSYLM